MPAYRSNRRSCGYTATGRNASSLWQHISLLAASNHRQRLWSDLLPISHLEAFAEDREVWSKTYPRDQHLQERGLFIEGLMNESDRKLLADQQGNMLRAMSREVSSLVVMSREGEY